MIREGWSLKADDGKVLKRTKDGYVSYMKAVCLVDKKEPAKGEYVEVLDTDADYLKYVDDQKKRMRK